MIKIGSEYEKNINCKDGHIQLLRMVGINITNKNHLKVQCIVNG